MAWTCLFSFVEMIAYSAATEGLAPVRDWVGAFELLGLSAAILGSAVIACTLNISGLFVIKRLGAVGMQMVSQMKSPLVIIGGVALLSEPVTRLQQIGFPLVLAGVYAYSQMKQKLESDAKGH